MLQQRIRTERKDKVRFIDRTLEQLEQLDVLAFWAIRVRRRLDVAYGSSKA